MVSISQWKCILKNPSSMKTVSACELNTTHTHTHTHKSMVFVVVVFSLKKHNHHHHHHHHQSFNREGRCGTTDDFATSFLHFSLFSTAFWDLRTPGLSLPWCCLLTFSSVCLVFFPFHCALRDGFGQTWWTGNMTIPLQLFQPQYIFFCLSSKGDLLLC